MITGQIVLLLLRNSVEPAKASFDTTTNEIDLSWDDPANDETGFRIERKTGATGTYAQIADLPAGTFTYPDGNNLVQGATYYYHVYAYQTGAPNSNYSVEANAQVPLPPSPTAPTNLNASYNSTSGEIDLSWDDSANDEAGFRIERKTGSGGTYARIADLPAGTFTYPDGNNLTPGATYFYRVYAYQTAEPNSGYSNEQSAQVPLPSGTISYLSDLPISINSNGWGPAELDHSNGETGAHDGHTITLNGVTYAKGIGVHATSDITYNLNGQYTTFFSDVGVDDEVGNNGTVEFFVYVDGVLKFDSHLMTGASATQSLGNGSGIDVTGASAKASSGC